MQDSATRQEQTSKKLQTFASRLRARRHRLDWTIEELAQKSDIAPRSIGAWEKGANLPQSKLLSQLADTLGVSIFWLLGEEETCPAGPGGTTEAEGFRGIVKSGAAAGARKQHGRRPAEKNSRCRKPAPNRFLSLAWL